MRCRCPDCGGAHDRQVQKGADVGFVSTALRGAYKNQYDRIILVAGDGDFTPMARMVACEEGKQIWIMGFEHTVSADLAGYCNNLIYLDSYKSALMRDAVEVPVA